MKHKYKNNKYGEMRSHTHKHICYFCKEKILGIPIPLRSYKNKIYKFNFAHKLCYDKNNERK